VQYCIALALIGVLTLTGPAALAHGGGSGSGGSHSGGGYHSSAGFRHAAHGGGRRGGDAYHHRRHHGGYGDGGYDYGGYWGDYLGFWNFAYGPYAAALPWYYDTYWWDDTPYYYADGVYYLWNEASGTYESVLPPQGLADQVQAQGPRLKELFVYPNAGQSASRLEHDLYECKLRAASESGFDPTAAAAPKFSDYLRAERACLEGRNYSAR
jgi:hypothetical protein